MTLGKGEKLFKLANYPPRDGSTVSTRMKAWLDANPHEAEPTDRDIAQILCPNESYVIHEVAEAVHYEQGKYHADDGTPVSYAPGVDLKVLY